MSKTKWEGLLVPARPLMEDERELLTPTCESCPLAASVVELQVPLTQETENAPLVELPNDALRFYCGHHAPIEVEDEVCDATDLEFYETTRVQIHCYKYEHLKVAANCLKMMPKCVSRCAPLRNLLCGVAPRVAQGIVERGEKLYYAKKKAEKENAK